MLDTVAVARAEGNGAPRLDDLGQEHGDRLDVEWLRVGRCRDHLRPNRLKYPSARQIRD